MEVTAFSGITEVATVLLLHRKGVDNLTKTKLHAKFNELGGDDPCTKIELSLEVNPTALGPLNELLSGICGLQGIHQLLREYYLNSATPLEIKLMSYINGIATGCFTGMLSSDGESSCVIRSTNDSFSSPPSLTGVCVMLQLPTDASCAWACAKYVARYFHLLCLTNTKVEFMINYLGNGHHRMVEYQCKDHLTINIQGHTLLTTLHPHYCHNPSLSARGNKLHAVRGKKQMISKIRVPSGDTMTLQLSIVSGVAPSFPSLATGKKLPADRLCRAIHVCDCFSELGKVMVYGPGGVPVFAPSSTRGLLLSQVVDWEDYGVAIGNPCCPENNGDNFDQTVVSSFGNELINIKHSTRSSLIEQSCILYVFLFFEAAVESVALSSTDSASRQLRSLQLLQRNLENIQLSHSKQFHTAFHTCLDKLLCNYNSFSKINRALEEAIPSVSEAVASIVSRGREESFQQSCHSLMEVEVAGEEVQQWLTNRLWRIASDKLGAQYHNGQLIRAAEEPDTPDITSATSHQPSLPSHDDDNALVTDVEEESVVTATQRRCYHPSVTSLHYHHTSQADNLSSQPDCVMAANSFTMLGSEDLEWSDTNCDTSSDVTGDKLWSDDDTVANNGILWGDSDDDSSTHSTDTILTTNDTLTCASTTNNPLLLQDEAPVLSSSVNMLEDTGLTNEITPSDVLVDKLPESIVTSNIVIPIGAPNTLTCDKALEEMTQDLEMTQAELNNTQAMDDNSQIVMHLTRDMLSEAANTCFDELVDLPSSPEAMAQNPTIECSPSIIQYQCLMGQLSNVNNTEEDDDFVPEDLDWN